MPKPKITKSLQSPSDSPPKPTPPPKKKGTVNHASGELKKDILFYLQSNFHKFTSEMATLEGKDYVDAFEKLCKVIIPQESNINLNRATHIDDTLSSLIDN